MNHITTLDKAVGTAAKLLRLLSEAGISEDELRKPIDDADMRRRLAALWKNDGRIPTVKVPSSEKILQIPQIFGIDTFGVEDAIRYLGICPKREDLLCFRAPPDEAILTKYAKTHFLVADFGISMRGMYDNHTLRRYFSDSCHYGTNFTQLSNSSELPRWRLIRRSPLHQLTLSDFGGKGMPKLKKLLGIWNEMLLQQKPTLEALLATRAMVYAHLAWYIKTGTPPPSEFLCAKEYDGEYEDKKLPIIVHLTPGGIHTEHFSVSASCSGPLEKEKVLGIPTEVEI